MRRRKQKEKQKKKIASYLPSRILPTLIGSQIRNAIAGKAKGKDMYEMGREREGKVRFQLRECLMKRRHSLNTKLDNRGGRNNITCCWHHLVLLVGFLAFSLQSLCLGDTRSTRYLTSSRARTSSSTPGTCATARRATTTTSATTTTTASTSRRAILSKNEKEKALVV